MNVIQGLGVGAGVVAERPIALAQNLFGLNPQPGAPQTRFGYGTILDPIAQGIGNLISVPGTVVRGFVNAGIAQGLKDNYGRPESALVANSIDALRGDTVAQLHAEALARGFTAQDIESLHAGTKGVYDFGQSPTSGQPIGMNPDPLLSSGLSLVTDPLNLLFGAGLISKGWQGVKLVERLQTLGVLAPRAISAVESGALIAEGSADAVRFATLRGIGSYLVHHPVQAYWRGSIGLTAVELGASVIPVNDGFLGGLRQTGRALLDNRPLSDTMVFSLLAAFSFPLHEYGTAAQNVFRDVKYRGVGNAMSNRLAADVGTGATLDEQLASVRAVGGPDVLNQMRYHALQKIVLDPARGLIAPAMIDAYRAVGSNAQLVWSYTKMDAMVDGAIRDALRKNEIRPTEVTRAFRDWFTQEQGGFKGKDVGLAWDGPTALEAFVNWRANVALVAPVWRATGQALIGLSRIMDKSAFEDAARILKSDAKNGMVPIATVRQVLVRYPRIVADEVGTYFQQLGIENAPETVSLRSLTTRLRNRGEAAPTGAQIFHETRAFEAAAPPDAEPVVGPVSRTGTLDSGYASKAIGEAVSSPTRYSDNRLHAMGMAPTSAAEAQSLRSNPIIRAAGATLGDDLHTAGFNVQAVQETVQSRPGGTNAPGLDIVFRRASLDEQRLVSALLGRAWKQHEVVLSVPAEQLYSKGLTANGSHWVWNIALHDAPTLERVNALMKAHFPEGGFTLKDSADLLDLKLRETDITPETLRSVDAINAELRNIYGVDAMGQPHYVSSVAPVYIERIGQHGDVTYESILRGAHNDPRLATFEQLRRGHAIPLRPARVPPSPVAGQGPGGQPAAPPEAVNLGGAGGVAGVPDALVLSKADFVRDVQDLENLVHAAEKTDLALEDWSPEMRTAYDAGNWREFSRLRGYSEAEIADYGQYQALFEGLTPEQVRSTATMSPDGSGMAVDASKLYDIRHETATPRTPIATTLPPDATGQMHAVESVIHEAADPTIPPLQTTLRAQADLAANGNDFGQTLWNVYRDTEVGRELPIPHFDPRLGEDMNIEFKQGLSALRNQITEASGGLYDLVHGPQEATFLNPAGDTVLAGALRERTQLGNFLDRFGPTSNFQRFWEWLTAPKQNTIAYVAARQALMNSLLPHAATPKQVARWLELMQEDVKRFTSTKEGFSMFRGPGGLPPWTINHRAREAFGPKTVEAVGAGNFWKLLDRAGNQFVRAVTNKEYRGGQLGALEKSFKWFYTKEQNALFNAGAGTRLISKTLYPLYRFASDPRWWAMNLLEADILGLMRYGMEATRFTGANTAPLSRQAELHKGIGPLQDAGLAFERNRDGYISRSLEVATRGNPEAIIHALPQVIVDDLNTRFARDPMLRELAQRFGPTEKFLAEVLNDQTYNFDKYGVKQTIVGGPEMRAWSVEVRTEMEPFITKLWQMNQRTHDSITGYFYGNNSRANWERVMNSYWLYWPISYQLKAARWLFDVTTKGALGYKTNLAGAAAYNQLVQMHKARMAKEPAYAKTFTDHPVLWGIAQMLMPITPADLGVSLSRPVRYAGGALHAWGAYKEASDPFSAAAAIMTMGSTYSSELLARLGGEFFPTRANEAP
jgi:hypothetical protein